MTNRRQALRSLGLSAFMLAPGPTRADALPRSADWARGIDGQRQPDLGNGTYLNPIMAGDHPDPSVLKDREDYFITFSTFEAYPGLGIWHSRDLINWRLVCMPLSMNVGSVWAPELIKHEGRFFLYFATMTTSIPTSRTTCWVISAASIEGPWSEPINLNLPDHIDPGHAVGEDGSRWLFLSGGDRVRLSADGLSTMGAPEHVVDPWHYPNDWDVEGFSPEGPKITRRGDFYYLVMAVGGTAGPPTGHMVIAARSRSIHGPWEHHPRNPLVRTENQSEKWWSRGHATLVEGPSGDWWSVYHGYENGFWTLGRQTLLAPIAWDTKGWFDFLGGDLSEPIRKPGGGTPQPHGLALSDDFDAPELGAQWCFFRPSVSEGQRVRLVDRTLHLSARGQAPSDSTPLVLTASDQDYEVECELEIDAGTTAGLLLFYDHQLYAGLSIDDHSFVFHKYGIEHTRLERPAGRKLLLRLRNRRHIVSFHTSTDGRTWQRFEKGAEVSGYHHNVRGGFLALKPGLYAAGLGEARFRNFRYRGLQA